MSHCSHQAVAQRAPKPRSEDGKLVKMKLGAHPVGQACAPYKGNLRKGAKAEGCGCPQTHGHRCAPACLPSRGSALLLGERRACSSSPTGHQGHKATFLLGVCPANPIQITSAIDGTKPKTILQKTGELDSKGESVSSLPQWSECRRTPRDRAGRPGFC